MYFVLGEGSIYIAQNVNRGLYIFFCVMEHLLLQSCFKCACHLVHSTDSYKYCLLVDYNFWSCTEQDVCSNRVLIMGCLGIQITFNFKIGMQEGHLF
jgi:hypothetical protein